MNISIDDAYVCIHIDVDMRTVLPGAAFFVRNDWMNVVVGVTRDDVFMLCVHPELDTVLWSVRRDQHKTIFAHVIIDADGTVVYAQSMKKNCTSEG